MVKPCPFCGVLPKVWDRVAEVGGGDIQDVFLIQCVNVDCGVKPQVIIGGERGYGPVSWEENHTNEEAAALVVERWNRRMPETLPIEAVDAVEAALSAIGIDPPEAGR